MSGYYSYNRSRSRDYSSQYYPNSQTTNSGYPNVHRRHNRLYSVDSQSSVASSISSSSSYRNHDRYADFHPQRGYYGCPPPYNNYRYNHRRTLSTTSSLSSTSSRFSSYDEQRRYLESFEATLAPENPFNQRPEEPAPDYFKIPPPPTYQQNAYNYPPPPSRMRMMLNEIRKYDTEKLKTLKTMSVDEIMRDGDAWLKEFTVDALRFRVHDEEVDDYGSTELGYSSSSSSSENPEDEYEGEFTHHLHNILDLINS